MHMMYLNITMSEVLGKEFDIPCANIYAIKITGKIVAAENLFFFRQKIFFSFIYDVVVIKLEGKEKKKCHNKV